MIICYVSNGKQISLNINQIETELENKQKIKCFISLTIPSSVKFFTKLKSHHSKITHCPTIRYHFEHHTSVLADS